MTIAHGVRKPFYVRAIFAARQWLCHRVTAANAWIWPRGALCGERAFECGLEVGIAPGRVHDGFDADV